MHLIVLLINRIYELVKKANSSLGYLKIITPRTQKSQTGITKIVLNENSNDTKSSYFKPTSNWSGTNLDPCSVKRHQNSLKRAGFKNNADAKGIF